MLEALLGDVLDPIFTPPWNRCTTDTGAVLAELGIGVLSRDVTVKPLGVPGLAELPVQVDWFAHSKGRRLDRHELGALLAARASGPTPMGVMLHHAVMDDEELVGVAELLQVLTDHDQVRLRSMTAVAATITTGEMA